jgi:N-acetylated-alpha-linked acidic dipeptidase
VHVAGTHEQTVVIGRLAEQYRSYGYEVKLYDYRVLLSYQNYSQPNTIELMVADRVISLISNGTGVPLGNAEAMAQQSDARAPVWWNAYATGGSVTKSIVYANYGRLSDFDQLKTNGINVTDRIALMRYSRVFRADMVAEASRRGAVGAILFSDPIDYAPSDSGHTFPDGIWLPASGAQRGSLKTGAGDPQTPLYPSADYAYRVPESELKASGAIPRIPVMPIGYRDAIGIFKAMDGPEVPLVDWQGGMNVKYRWNSSDSIQFRLNVSCVNEQRTITNVLAYMRGLDEPDRTILFSNHFDAWVSFNFQLNGCFPTDMVLLIQYHKFTF